jgi:hypothetical protein
MRRIATPFLVAPPGGARIRTRLRLDATDEQVLSSVGEHLGMLAGVELARRHSEGRLDAKARAASRWERKQALTAASSSRWAGTITRTSEDQWDRAFANLLDARAALRRASKTIQARLAVPVGQRHGRLRGYASQAERFAKQGRLQHTHARLADVEQQIAQGRVSICRGGRRLAKLYHSLDRDDALLTQAEWRECWRAKRWFLTADGEADKPWGNETIRVHPDQQWLELRLPTPLAHMSNTPSRAATYRLSCPVRFSYRTGEWAAQAASGAVRYDLFFDSAKQRWYLDASWRLQARMVPSLNELAQARTLGVDLNATHLDCWVLDPCGNPVGMPHTIPLDLDGCSTTTRDGRLRAAVSAIVRLAIAHGCRSVMVENLDFADARQTGRETLGHGKRGRQFRRIVGGIPTGRFRDLLVGMATNAGLWVVAVDPSWTSMWGRRYWLAPLNQSTKHATIVTGHHAAAVVIARRGLGLGARRRPGVPRPHRRMGNGELPARPGSKTQGCEGPGPPGRPAGSGTAAQDQPRPSGPGREPGDPGPFGVTRQR